MVSLAAAITLCGMLVGGVVFAHGRTEATPLVPICTYTINKVINSTYKEQNLTGSAVEDETVSLVGKYDSGNPNYYCGMVAGEYSIYCDSVNDCGGLSVFIEVNGVANTNTQGPTQVNSFTTSTWLSGWFTTGNPSGQTALAHNNLGTIQS